MTPAALLPAPKVTRWGAEPPRTVSLSTLTAAQRRLVLALVEAARAEGAAGEATTDQTPPPEGRPRK